MKCIVWWDRQIYEGDGRRRVCPRSFSVLSVELFDVGVWMGSSFPHTSLLLTWPRTQFCFPRLDEECSTCRCSPDSPCSLPGWPLEGAWRASRWPLPWAVSPLLPLPSVLLGHVYTRYPEPLPHPTPHPHPSPGSGMWRWPAGAHWKCAASTSVMYINPQIFLRVPEGIVSLCPGMSYVPTSSLAEILGVIAVFLGPLVTSPLPLTPATDLPELVWAKHGQRHYWDHLTCNSEMN